MNKQCKDVFPIVNYYNASVPTYPSGSIGFFFCSKRYGHNEVMNTRTASRASAPTPPGSDEQYDVHGGMANMKSNIEPMKYYTSEIHHGAFILPGFLKALLA